MVAPLGAVIVSLLCVIVATSPTLVSCGAPPGAVIVMDAPVAVEPEFVRVSVYVPLTAAADAGSVVLVTVAIAGHTAFTIDARVPVSE